jgi:hypothetical protein
MYIEDERMFVVKPVEGADNDQQFGNGHNGVASHTNAVPAALLLSDGEMMRAREAAQRYSFADNVSLH